MSRFDEGPLSVRDPPTKPWRPCPSGRDGLTFHRGIAYELKGRMSKALRDWKRAYDLGNRSQSLVEKLREHGVLE